jgi:Fe-S-cluster-containing hydrogenase component 2
MCTYVCPVQAIQLLPDGAHIDLEKCIGCGICYRNCASEAIQKIDVGTVDETDDKTK